MSVRFVLGLAAAGALAACGNQTGILLEIHKDAGVSSEVYKLRVFVGVGHDGNLYRPEWWAAAQLDAEDAQVTLQKEMAGDTFRLLLEPSGALVRDSDLMFAVAGYKSDQSKPVVFGHSTTPIQFGDGQVRVLDLPMATFSDARHGVTVTGCAWWNATDDRNKQDAIAPLDDGDCDAFTAGHDEGGACQLDCNDKNPAIHPGATEICDNGVDENCCADNDGKLDLDGDGFATCGAGEHDCVDGPRGGVGETDAFGDNVPPEDINPAAAELCDGIDNNCSGTCDEAEGFDGDGDGYLNCRRTSGPGTRTVGVHVVTSAGGGSTCQPSGLDCADTGTVGNLPAASIHPGAADNQCDGIDEDCDGSCDQSIVGIDADGDGFNLCNTEADYVNPSVPVCMRGTGEDCGRDDNQFAYPGGAERCDGVDFDCDGVLFPAHSPCFVLVTDASETRCLLGQRTCDDSPGVAGNRFGACVHDVNGPQTPLPMAWCTTSTCTDQDPVQCLGSNLQQCTVRFPVGAGGTATTNSCPTPPAEVLLPTDGLTAGCAYALVGGQSQGEWNVTLVNPQGLTGPTATGCGSKLRAVGAVPAAEDRSVLVVSTVGPHVYRLQREDGCDSQANMVCN